MGTTWYSLGLQLARLEDGSDAVIGELDGAGAGRWAIANNLDVLFYHMSA